MYDSELEQAVATDANVREARSAERTQNTRLRHCTHFQCGANTPVEQRVFGHVVARGVLDFDGTIASVQFVSRGSGKVFDTVCARNVGHRQDEDPSWGQDLICPVKRSLDRRQDMLEYIA